MEWQRGLAGESFLPGGYLAALTGPLGLWDSWSRTQNIQAMEELLQRSTAARSPVLAQEALWCGHNPDAGWAGYQAEARGPAGSFWAFRGSSSVTNAGIRCK